MKKEDGSMLDERDEKEFKRITGISMRCFLDPLFAPLKQHKIDIVKYLECCESRGMTDDESIEQFNLRMYPDGARLNEIMKKYF